MMVKKGTVPNWDLIYDGGGTHINTFTFRVTCDGLVATGTGRCKKDAKHIAAQNMLKLIAAERSLPQLPPTPADSPVRTPHPPPLPASSSSTNEPFINAIGDLKDLCADNELQDPEYNLISDVGPPHARVFTYQCVVSTFKEEGKATTKKQAKHEASRKMLDRLLEVVKDMKSINTSTEEKNESNDRYTNLRKERYEPKAMRETIMCQYEELVQKRPSRKGTLGIKLDEYHKKLKQSYTDDTLPTRSEVLAGLENLDKFLDDTKNDTSDGIVQCRKDKFNEFLNLLNVDADYVTVDHSAKDYASKILFLKMNTRPQIVEIAIGEDPDEIELRAMSKVVKIMQEFMH